MNEYLAQAKQFLADCNAEMEIKFLCKTNPTWDEKLLVHHHNSERQIQWQVL